VRVNPSTSLIDSCKIIKSGCKVGLGMGVAVKTSEVCETSEVWVGDVTWAEPPEGDRQEERIKARKSKIIIFIVVFLNCIPTPLFSR
jgi:hypothetical protein